MSLWLYINILDLLLGKKMETRLEKFERSCKLIFDVPQSPLGPNSELLMEECGREKSNLAFVESDNFNLHVQSNIVSDSDPVEDSCVLGILDKPSIVLNSCVPFDSTAYSPDNSSSYDEKNKEIVTPPATECSTLTQDNASDDASFDSTTDSEYVPDTSSSDDEFDKENDEVVLQTECPTNTEDSVPGDATTNSDRPPDHGFSDEKLQDGNIEGTIQLNNF